MRRKIKKYLGILVAITGSAIAQDMHFTQFYASPTFLNPAFAGANACSRVTLTYRNQWPGITKAYRSYLLSGDHFFSQYNLGAGLLVGSDVAGSGNLRTTIINPMLAYEAKFGRDFGMRFGLQPGVTSRSVDYNKLIFGDQVAQGNSVSTIEIPKPTITFFNIGTGVLCYTSKYWAGLSFYNLNRPNQSLIGSEDAILPIRYTFHGGFKYNINEDEKDDFKKKSISAAFHYRGQKKFDQFDIGLYYMQSIITAGVWYRGLPLKAYKPGYANHDAVAVIIGAKTDRAYFGYSYDITISKLAGATRGAHEITMSYQFCKPKKKKKRIEVACPKF